MKSISYKTSGTCSQMINLKVDDNDCIVDVSFEAAATETYREYVPW